MSSAHNSQPQRLPPSENGPVVGGLPWAQSMPSQRAVAGQPALPPPSTVASAAAVGTTAHQQPNAARRSRPNSQAPQAVAAKRRLPSAPTANRVDRLLRQVKAASASLIVHTLLLLVFAILVVGQSDSPLPPLELAFSTPGDDPGGSQADVVMEDAEDPSEEETPEDDSAEPETEPTPPAETVAEDTATEPPPEFPDTDQAEMAVAAADGEAAPEVGAPAVEELLAGRSPARRADLLGRHGGTAETESAVVRALEWIVRQQRRDGSWSLTGPYRDGGRVENSLAATSMAMLALQGAGNTTEEGPYREAVRKAAKKLVLSQGEDGRFDLGPTLEQQAMYAQAQATIAICELFALTRDPSLEVPAHRALEFAQRAQMPDGGWKYRLPSGMGENDVGDMSVTGWFVMALKSGEMAGLPPEPDAYAAVGSFLDNVFVSPEQGYGYQINGHNRGFKLRPALTAEGLLCRQYLGCPRNAPELTSGINLLLDEVVIDFGSDDAPAWEKDIYAWYYITQVCHHIGGRPWQRWNANLRSRVPAAQVSTGAEKGSWNPAYDQWGDVGGRLYATCLCTCMLEVYYRHLPLYGELPPAGPPVTAAVPDANPPH